MLKKRRATTIGIAKLMLLFPHACAAVAFMEAVR